mmetsp:Transcript_102885/g.320584  ORF Transcript_102885/g.320584 Transcript_102885/m.320584 type:complete len:256 (-) Transcript_102885:1136-1903(-)
MPNSRRGAGRRRRRRASGRKAGLYRRDRDQCNANYQPCTELGEVGKLVPACTVGHEVGLVGNGAQHLARDCDAKYRDDLVDGHVHAPGDLGADGVHQDHHRGAVEDDPQGDRGCVDRHQQPSPSKSAQSADEEVSKHLGHPLLTYGLAQAESTDDGEHRAELHRTDDKVHRRAPGQDQGSDGDEDCLQERQCRGGHEGDEAEQDAPRDDRLEVEAIRVRRPLGRRDLAQDHEVGAFLPRVVEGERGVKYDVVTWC